MSPQSPLSLVADIGGTNTRVALARGPQVDAASIRRFRNADHAGLAQVLTAYLTAEGGAAPCAGACVAVAGPVRDGRGTLTNLDWTIDEATLAQASGAGTVSILNDLQAQGHALGRIAPDCLTPLIAGPEAPAFANKLVVGVGTGFNAAAVHDGPTGRLVTPSEAGHASMPVTDDQTLRLAGYVRASHGFAAVEDVLSGRGLERIHAWLCAEEGVSCAASSTEIIADLGPRGDARKTAAVARFVALLGAAAGDLSLIHLPFGGVYLVGGMTRAVAPVAAEFGFAEAFRAKGRFSAFMENFPVTLVEDDYAALTGCAAHLDRLFRAPA